MNGRMGEQTGHGQPFTHTEGGGHLNCVTFFGLSVQWTKILLRAKFCALKTNKAS